MRLTTTLPVEDWKDEFLERGIQPGDLKTIKHTSAGVPVIYTQKGPFSEAGDLILVEFEKPAAEVYVDYDYGPSAVADGHLEDGAETFENLKPYPDDYKYDYMFGSFVKDIKPNEIVSVRKGDGWFDEEKGVGVTKGDFIFKKEGYLDLTKDR